MPAITLLPELLVLPRQNRTPFSGFSDQRNHQTYAKQQINSKVACADGRVLAGGLVRLNTSRGPCSRLRDRIDDRPGGFSRGRGYLVETEGVEPPTSECKTDVLPLAPRPRIGWGGIGELNSCIVCHRHAPKPLGQSRHEIVGALPVSRTLFAGVQARCIAGNA